MQVGDRVALRLDVGGRSGGAGGVDKVEGAVVVGIVAVQAGAFDFFQGSVFYQVIDQGGHNLHVGQLFCADVRQNCLGLGEGHDVALGEVT